MSQFSADSLRIKQDMPLEAKVIMSQQRIRQWHDHWHGQTYVAFSGGKDSTVLLDLVRGVYPKTPAVFVDTGLEYPEVRDFVKTVDGVEWIRPAMTFRKVLETYGYPVVNKEQAKYIREVQRGTTDYMREKRLNGTGKHKSGKISEKWQYLIDAPFKVDDRCCDVMKKRPSHVYSKKTGRMPYVGTMAVDSTLRKQRYIRKGCNAFDGGNPMSTPLAFWKQEDIWGYIESRGLSYSKIYDMGEKQTGCMWCMFGVHLDTPENRFQRMYVTHPKLWSYCMDKLGLRDILAYLGVPCEPEKTLFEETQ